MDNRQRSLKVFPLMSYLLGTYVVQDSSRVALIKLSIDFFVNESSFSGLKNEFFLLKCVYHCSLMNIVMIYKYLFNYKR